MRATTKIKKYARLVKVNGVIRTCKIKVQGLPPAGCRGDIFFYVFVSIGLIFQL